MTDDAAFVHGLVAAVPPLQAVLAQHLADYEELLPHVFMGDVSRFMIGQYNEHLEGSSGSLAVLEQLFSALERGASEGAERVQEMITVSFLENVAEEMTLFPDLQSFLGPTLKHELRGVLDGFGYP